LQGPTLSLRSIDYGPALWAPARTGHYQVASRPSSSPIRYVVVHTTEGSYAGTISWFQSAGNPYRTSAHYVLRSSDGQITQMVREKDIAHHVRGYGLVSGYSNNAVSIGIEHEAISSNPVWFTDAMYRASAALTRSICLKYGIPMDRSHIRGHVEVPENTHTDPGPYWNWDYYMQLVTQSASWSAIVDNTTSGRFTASGNWGASSYSSQRYGADYRYATPQAVSDAAWFKFNIPATASYDVYVWYPANAGYSASTPFVIATASGSVYVYVNQQINGGAWVSLGTFTLSAGDYNVVGVSRWTNASGYVIADAVRIVRR
jgi:N-acetyl-anhydromuramyl-L-alanine amidase AmpD